MTTKITDSTEQSAAGHTLRLRLRVGQVANGFRALRVRNYRLYWTGQLISVIGTWMQSTAQAWLVYKLTDSPFALGLVTTLQFLPVMLLSLFGGVIADRVQKRNLMVVTQTLLLIQAAVFGVLVATGAIQIWHIYALAIMQGLINTVDNPVRQSLPVELVGREDVGNAVALNSMIFNAARVIGPSVAGVLIAQIGIAPALFINAVSFVAVIAALLMMNAAEFHTRPPRARQPALRELADGVKYAWKTPAIITILVVIVTIGTFGYNFSTVLPLLGGFVLHTDAAGFGALSTMLGLGSLAGALVVAYTKQAQLRRLFIGSALFTMLLAVLAATNVFLVAGLTLAALGFAGILFSTTANTLLQTITTDEYRGRVMSLYVLLFIGVTPVGAFTTGTLADKLGVPAALLLEAGVCAAGLSVAVVYHRWNDRRRILRLRSVQETDDGLATNVE